MICSVLSEKTRIISGKVCSPGTQASPTILRSVVLIR